MAKKQSKNATWTAIVVLFLVAGTIYVWRPDERFRSAWAFASPPLTGHWEGVIETPTGKRFPIFLTLTYHDPNNGPGIGRHRAMRRGYGRFDGQAIVCDSPLKAAAYKVDGSPEDRHGTELRFFTEAVGQHDGITPGHFNAAWDGTDAIRGSVQYSWRRGVAAISGPDYPDTQGPGTVSLLRTETAATIADCSRTKPMTNPSDRLAQTGRVTDAAHILSPAQRESLAERLEQLEKESGDQMVVATVPDLGGQDIAIFARNLRTRWKIGHEHMDDGVLILVAPKDGKARIAVGRGIQHRLPDSLSQTIMDEQMLPRFKQGDFFDGLKAGIASLMQHLR